MAKAALYDSRVDIPQHELLFTELRSVEYDPEKGKVDHNSMGTKDVADALVGVLYGLTMRREIWLTHNVSLLQIPESIKQGLASHEGDEAKNSG